MLISLDSYADEKQLRSDKNEVNGQNRDITIKFTVKQANKMSLKLNVRFVNSSFSTTTKKSSPTQDNEQGHNEVCPLCEPGESRLSSSSMMTSSSPLYFIQEI